MAKTILSNNQIKILEAVSNNDAMCQKFYLTGGTALAEYYLRHGVMYTRILKSIKQ